MKRPMIIVAVVLVVIYVGDFFSFRLGIPARDTLGSVTVHTTYVVKLKNGRSEYDDGGERIVSCTNSLLPQMGGKPCWYARRRTEETVTIDSGDPNNPHLF